MHLLRIIYYLMKNVQHLLRIIHYLMKNVQARCGEKRHTERGANDSFILPDQICRASCLKPLSLSLKCIAFAIKNRNISARHN